MRLECNFTVHQERKTLDCYYELRGRQHFCLFMQLSPGVFMIIGGQLLARFSVSLCNYPLEYPGNISVSLCNTGSKVRSKCLEYVLVRNAAFCCARRHQKWNPEILYMRKMVSHAQNGLLGAKLEFNVLICVLVRIAASFCARRCQNWIPEILHMQKMVLHAQNGLQSPEIAQCLSQLPVLSQWLQRTERLRDWGHPLYGLEKFWNSQGSLDSPPGGHIPNLSS